MLSKLFQALELASWLQSAGRFVGRLFAKRELGGALDASDKTKDTSAIEDFLSGDRPTDDRK